MDIKAQIEARIYRLENERLGKLAELKHHAERILMALEVDNGSDNDIHASMAAQSAANMAESILRIDHQLHELKGLTP